MVKMLVPEEGFALLDRHLARLEESRRYFGYDPPGQDVRSALASAVREGGGQAQRVRLLCTLEHLQQPVGPRRHTSDGQSCRQQPVRLRGIPVRPTAPQCAIQLVKADFFIHLDANLSNYANPL